jgi:hypothetical protein
MNEQHEAGMKIPQLAERWHVGDSTIRRVLQQGKKPGVGAETVQRILHLAAKRYDGDEYISGVPAIAKAVGESERVVSAVLANHRPLVPASGVFARAGRSPVDGSGTLAE